jgi:hypothetical protein
MGRSPDGWQAAIPSPARWRRKGWERRRCRTPPGPRPRCGPGPAVRHRPAAPNAGSPRCDPGSRPCAEDQPPHHAGRAPDGPPAHTDPTGYAGRRHARTSLRSISNVDPSKPKATVSAASEPSRSSTSRSITSRAMPRMACASQTRKVKPAPGVSSPGHRNPGPAGRCDAPPSCETAISCQRSGGTQPAGWTTDLPPRGNPTRHVCRQSPKTDVEPSPGKA